MFCPFRAVVFVTPTPKMTLVSSRYRMMVVEKEVMVELLLLLLLEGYLCLSLPYIAL